MFGELDDAGAHFSCAALVAPDARSEDDASLASADGWADEGQQPVVASVGRVTTVEHDARLVVRRGYDRVASSYLAARPVAGADVALLGRLVDRLAPGGMVLDAGCGAGRPVSEALRRLGLAVIGLDLSRRQLELARHLAHRTQGDLAALPFASGSFDGVVSYYAIFHLPRAEHPRVFAELRRVLTPGGSGLLCLGSRDVPEDYDPDSWLGQPMYWSQYDAETNLRLLEASGLAPLWHDQVVEDPMGHQHHLFALVEARG